MTLEILNQSKLNMQQSAPPPAEGATLSVQSSAILCGAGVV